MDRKISPAIPSLTEGLVRHQKLPVEFPIDEYSYNRKYANNNLPEGRESATASETAPQEGDRAHLSLRRSLVPRNR